LIEEGRIETANKALGYSYFIRGTVTEGKKLGRTLGFPTANIIPLEPAKLLPRNGVYAVKVDLGNKKLKGMLNIGIRPTLEDHVHHRTIEVNLFDFNRDIYGKDLQINFMEWLRLEKKFGSLLELKEQLQIDKEEVLKIFNRTTDNIK
jgi:riboflavin kinase/FMN adenylyltransferase